MTERFDAKPVLELCGPFDHRAEWVLILFLLAGAMGLPVSVVLGQGGTVNVSAQMVSIPGGTYTIGTDRARARVTPT